MKKLVYDPLKSGKRMNIVCFISGSGTNYQKIVNRDRDHNYLVFTNRPGCSGVSIARENGHPVIEFSHVPYLKEAWKKYGTGKVPRNCPERLAYDLQVVNLVENKIGREPDLICLAGYDQLNTDWFVDRYYPKILNVHPGDNTKGYSGLHWTPAAKAVLAGERELRSTLFFVDKGVDTGPVLVQSAPLDITTALEEPESGAAQELQKGLNQIKFFADANNIQTYEEFSMKANQELLKMLEIICAKLQDALKVAGDWKIYPFAVHDLIARGRVDVDNRDIYVDGQLLPIYGYRLDEH